QALDRSLEEVPHLGWEWIGQLSQILERRSREVPKYRMPQILGVIDVSKWIVVEDAVQLVGVRGRLGRERVLVVHLIGDADFGWRRTGRRELRGRLCGAVGGRGGREGW
ncbi:hypothetical protein PMAYCL1PPCAC_07926, partial [Pristionchus mayeri]